MGDVSGVWESEGEFGRALKIGLVVFLLCATAFAVVGCCCECDDGKNLRESSVIAADAKGWLRERIGNVPDVSAAGVELVIDREISTIRTRAGRTKAMEKIMVYGSAIDALEKERECVRRMREPVKCLGMADIMEKGE